MSTPTEDAKWNADLGFALSMALASFAHKRTMRVAHGLERAPTAARVTREFGRHIQAAANGMVPGVITDADVERAASAVAQPRRPAPMTAEESVQYHGLFVPAFSPGELGKKRGR